MCYALDKRAHEEIGIGIAGNRRFDFVGQQGNQVWLLGSGLFGEPGEVADRLRVHAEDNTRHSRSVYRIMTVPAILLAPSRSTSGNRLRPSTHGRQSLHDSPTKVQSAAAERPWIGVKMFGGEGWRGLA